MERMFEVLYHCDNLVTVWVSSCEPLYTVTTRQCTVYKMEIHI